MSFEKHLEGLDIVNRQVAVIDHLQQQLMQCQREKAAALADVDKFRAHLEGSTLNRRLVMDERDGLLALLRDCYDLLAVVPMSYPYNDRAAELRTRMHPALAKKPAEGGKK